MELNGNCTVTSESVEDLSEYTDADESISAPTEILAEFLSAVMLKDYETALKYCKLILQYEPNHVTAKEFYPLILEKLIQASAEAGEGNSNEGSDSSDEESGERSDTSSSSGADVESCGEERVSSDSDGTTASYSSLEDEVAQTGVCKLPDNYLPPTSENGNPPAPLQTDDSESPTEPVSQLASAFALLR
ncbi:glutamate-rich protein 2 [Halyomorpha halys]|uniref:glutamate-rich protein 2 n=1 Tax=Halyomorpha halys TaxID=286706 RepID=UPI0006D4F295|nr:glutamate-rich protein 2 [Halyomorpha halys]